MQWQLRRAKPERPSKTGKHVEAGAAVSSVVGTHRVKWAAAVGEYAHTFGINHRSRIRKTGDVWQWSLIT